MMNLCKPKIGKILSGKFLNTKTNGTYSERFFNTKTNRIFSEKFFSIKTNGISMKLLAVIMVCCMCLAAVPAEHAEAAANGIYLATSTPHYRHPSTGVIEDSGGESSEVLGQSMTESATDTTALVEVDAQGNTYITVRLKLMDNIQDPQFQVDGKSVSATLMQEDYTNNTADYRMKVNSENSVIRCNMYVVPMGRSVIFFITVSGLHEGSGDFITSVTVDKSSNTDTQQSQGSASQNNAAGVNAAQSSDTQPQADTDTANQSSAASNSDVNADSTVAAASNDVITSDTSSQAVDAQTATESAAGTTEAAAATMESAAPEKTDAKGIAEFDESGKEVNKKASDKNDADKNKSNTVLWVVIGIVVVAAAGFGGWYFFVFKKKNTKGDAK